MRKRKRAIKGCNVNFCGIAGGQAGSPKYTPWFCHDKNYICVAFPLLMSEGISIRALIMVTS